MTIVLRPRQQQAITETKRALASGNRAPIINAATGAGKTVIAAGIIQGAIQKQKRALFLAHREELITQAHDKLREFGHLAGIIKSGHRTELFRPVQVASVQTLVRRMNRLDFKPDLILIDEAHLSNAKSYKAIVEHYGNPILLGLTATPQRLDGSGLGVDHGGMFDCIIPAGTTRELIDEGFLCPFDYFAPPLVDTAGVHTKAGEFDTAELEAITDNNTVTGDFLEHWRKRALGLPTMVFAVSVKHAEHIAEQARTAGINAVAVSGDSERTLRRDAVRDVQTGAIQMLVNCGLFVEGLDAPALACLGDLAATKSISRFRQKIGRVLRTYPGKTKAIILDHVGNCMRHGLPDAHIEWSLEGRKKKPAIISLRTCPTCFATHMPAPICPQCGHIYMREEVAREPPPQVEGELIQVTDEIAKQIEKKRLRQEVGMAKTREALEKIARDRGYSPGWVHIQWELKKKQAAAKYARNKSIEQFYQDLP